MHTTIAPALSSSFSVIAERFRRSGHADRAIALCREGLAVFPDHLSARVTLGCALLDLGRDLEAHRELQSVIKRAPDNLAAIRGLAELHARGIEEQDQRIDAHELAEDVRVALEAESALVAAGGPASTFAVPPPEVTALAELPPEVTALAELPLEVTALAELPLEAPPMLEPVEVRVEPMAPAALFAVPHVEEAKEVGTPLALAVPVDPPFAEIDAVAEERNDLAALFAPATSAVVPLNEFDPVLAWPVEPEAQTTPVPAALSLDEFDPVVESAAAMAMPVPAPVSLDEFDPVVACSAESAAAETLPVLAVSLDEFDPVVARSADSAAAETLPVLAVSLDEFDPVVACSADSAAAETLPVLAVSLDEFDPVVEAPPLQFELEDVISQAEDEPAVDLRADDDFGLAGVEELPRLEPPAAAASPITVLDDWLTRIHARREVDLGVATAGPGPTGAPIVVLDDWLKRIQARRSELLSQYAAG